MPIRVSFPTDVCADPSVKYRRTLAEAFPCDARQAIAIQGFPAKKHTGRWLISALLLAVALILSGCSGAEAQERGASAADLQRAAAGAWNCPGMHAEWLDEFTVQCLKEKP